ncbi:MAG: DNA polymerase I, partial [Planctomycetota bacterium]
YIKKIVNAFNIATFEKEGYEADDLIGTIVKKISSPDIQTVIITGDKDMMQLVSERVVLLDTMKNKTTGPGEVMERFGITPGQLPDIFGLMGDKADNVPGVLGIGEKTAVALIKQFSSIENLFKNITSVKTEKLRNTLLKFKKEAEMSKKLCTIDTDAPVAGPDKIWTGGLDDFKTRESDLEKLRNIFKELEFSKFTKELTPQKKISYEQYQLIATPEALQKLTNNLKQVKEFAVDLETTGLNPLLAEIVGVAVAYEEHQAFYIPVAHCYEGAPIQLPRQLVLEELREALENDRIKKIGQNIKFDLMILKRYGINLNGVFEDVMLASYLLNPLKRNHNLEEIARDYLGHQIITYEDVTGTGRKQIGFDQVPVEQAKVYSAEDADAAFLLHNILKPRLVKEKLMDLFEQIEMPLVRVLADMEMSGIKIDKDFLRGLSDEFSERLKITRQKIYELSEGEFNIDSPKQLQVILFERLKLPVQKRTKTGFSTDSDVLAVLAPIHELPALILEYRSLAKLKSTYTDGFLELINPQTGRVHTSYNQSITATGRLSSKEPNLQNIPIRTDDGKKIRRAFIPEPGSIFISADYSQIELRILAHLSGDDVLVNAFKKGEDVHIHTAMEIFNVSADLVTTEMRRLAKTINFGIIYGMSAHGLSQELKINYEVAQEYIDHYFQKYQGVRSYLEGVIEESHRQGVVRTLFDRPRPLPDINSPNINSRNFAERTAVNSPIQGTAADIMKIAMIKIYQALNEAHLKTKMILQVHDELVFEVPPKEEKQILHLVKKEMEGCVKLKVPLKIDLGRGLNWAEMEPVKLESV